MKTSLSVLCIGFICLFSCKSNSQIVDPIPSHDSLILESKILKETRTINIWTPPEYASSTDSYPVLYMPDGGIKEDFPHIANTLNELIQAKKIQPIILVGIENTQRRRDLSGPSEVKKDKEIAPVIGGSEAFRNFIQAELFPEIEKKYRTNPKKGIIGESLAGLFVTETFLLTPNLFDFYIAFDPSLWWNDQFLLKNAKKYLDAFPISKKTFWFAGSSAKDISTNVRNLSEILKEKNAPNIQWEYSDEKKEKHNTIFRATKEKAIIWTLNNL